MLLFRGRSRGDQIKLHHQAVAGLRRCLAELDSLRIASGDGDGALGDIMRAGDDLVRRWGSLEFRIRNGWSAREVRRDVISAWKATQGYLEHYRRMAAVLEARTRGAPRGRGWRP